MANDRGGHGQAGNDGTHAAVDRDRQRFGFAAVISVNPSVNPYAAAEARAGVGSPFVASSGLRQNAADSGPSTLPYCSASVRGDAGELRTTKGRPLASAKEGRTGAMPGQHDKESK